MADEDEKQEEQDNTPLGRYKLMGAKGQGERVDRVVLEGPPSNPEKFVDLHGEVELTEKEAEAVRKDHNVELRKLGAAEDEAPPKGEEAQGPVVKSKAQQQAAQSAPGKKPNS